MKKTSIIFNLMGVVLCGLTTPASADFCSQNITDCCEWSILDGKMTVEADWLYWKVQQDGVLPGSIIAETDPSIMPVTTFARTVRPKYKYDSGFRVALGYELPCDCWDVNVAYTYVPSHAKTTTFHSESTLVYFEPVSAINAPRSISGSTTFASKWDLTLNNIDLDIGRTVCFGECLEVRPHIGFRATWFDQKFHSVGGSYLPGIVNGGTVKEKFQGYGVEGGLWADWKLGYGVSVVGHVGGSILYSKFKVHGEAFEGVLNAENIFTVDTVEFSSDCFYSGTPTLDYFAGLQYADTFCDMLFKAYVGWEQHVMFDTNKYLSTGNLSTQGLTLGLDVGF